MSSKTYTVTAWKEPSFYASIEIDADSAEAAIAAAENHDWHDESFEDCGDDYGDVTFLRAQHDAEDGTVEEADKDVSLGGLELAQAKARYEQLLDVLARVLPYAESHAEDWESGLDDGTYEDRNGLGRLTAAIAQADALLAVAGKGRIIA